MERKLILTIGALAALALATQVLVWVLAARNLSQAFIGPPRSDYSLANFTVDALDAEGHHAFSIAGPRLVRRAEDGSIFVTAPKYEIIDNSHNTWKGKSDSAWVNKDGSIMKFEGQVQMRRQPTPTVAPVELVTSDLTVTSDKAASPPRKTLETAALATITDPNHVVHGVGMKADMGMKVVELLSDVHWTATPSNDAGQGNL
jgi:lipopolysaccharide export system protein LptC